ncbi:MAG: SDR family NAD(P)-dependent oxidoreductase [Pelolinea sp.]|jgi:NAD(P)-dependent dehydrogenase (short-subunit alcohol dehydrogenase family)|nr:SDR family NAD(P)-dependent oxidoreductase [Pelolinea sp.]
MKLPVELQFIQNARLPQKTTSARLDGQICIITGATSGVGYHAARRLAQAGAQLILVCRNPQKASAVKMELEQETHARVEIVLADFSRMNEVRQAATTILDKYSHLDVLINNAGVHMLRRTLTEDGFETVFAVNHLASFLFTRLLLDRLLASAPARVIQVNSQGHRFGGLNLNDLTWKKRPYLGLLGYGASKTAQLFTVWEFAAALQGSGVTINAMHPGSVRTNIGMNNWLPYRLYNRFILRHFLKDPIISGEAIYYLAAAPEMKDVSGKFFNLTIEEVPAPHTWNRERGKQVWQISEQLTGLEPLKKTK